jgi:putative Mg2+ transporter-C (MgtC) family protein
MSLSFDWAAFIDAMTRLLGAFALALPIGWERQREARTAGLRTFPLVAAASSAYVLIGTSLDGTNVDAQSRLIQGLMTGIGFVGGGAILKSRLRVHGTATAAGIWMTGALGAAAGYGRWEIAVAVCVLTFGALHGLTLLERHITPERPEETERRPARRGSTRRIRRGEEPP